MKRREFFSMMAGAGLCATAAGRGALAGLTGGGTPMEVAYEGPMFITFAADGGWDPTGFCDPHANLFASYGNGDVTTAGGITYPNIANNAEFFTRFADKLLVLNGVDTSTNNHSIGRRHVWTGRQDATHPHWAALAAGSLGPGQPLAFIGEASQVATEGVVARSRVSGNGVLGLLSKPNEVAPGNPENLTTYHHEPTLEMIDDWRATRLSRMQEQQNLPHIAGSIDKVVTARSGSNELALLESYLPELSNNEIERQIQIAIAAYKAGIAVSASFGMNGFDTHENNDSNQNQMRAALLGHVTFFMDEAERQGVQDMVVVTVGSDFGRTPEYNGRNGKNHWPITSMLLMGWGIEGNRTVGATDSGQNALRVDPDTLALANDGIKLRPAHVHAALRELAGVSAELDARYPLGVDPLPALLGTP